MRVKLQASTEKEVEEKLQRYLEEYNPWGYGTRVMERGKESVGYYIVVTRASSCD